MVKSCVIDATFDPIYLAIKVNSKKPNDIRVKKPHMCTLRISLKAKIRKLRTSSNKEKKFLLINYDNENLDINSDLLIFAVLGQYDT